MNFSSNFALSPPKKLPETSAILQKNPPIFPFTTDIFFWGKKSVTVVPKRTSVAEFPLPGGYGSAKVSRPWRIDEWQLQRGKKEMHSFLSLSVLCIWICIIIIVTILVIRITIMIMIIMIIMTIMMMMMMIIIIIIVVLGQTNWVDMQIYVYKRLSESFLTIKVLNRKNTSFSLGNSFKSLKFWVAQPKKM